MKCIDICPNGVHSLENGERILNREKCTGCGQCIKVCPSKALNLSGEFISIEELLKRIDRDSPFYLMGGGVTFSGGEPLIQKNYLKEMLFLCKQRGYHTAVESALSVSWKSIEEISCLVDLFIIDIKTINRILHKSAVGEVNDTILENIKKLSCMGNEIWIRIPIIPSINDKVEDIVSIAEFIKNLKNVTKVELIPFHRLAINKYDSLGINYKASELVVPSTDLINSLNDKLKSIIECC
jgi:pyruvate formate lyase activating enzyme